VLRGQRSDMFRVRESSLEHHLPWLDAQWVAGHCTAPTCGVASRRKDLGARCGSLPSGRDAVGVPKCPMLRACSACRPQELSPA
jgi:hypothetical protein